MMNKENRTCQNCSQKFVIEPDDFSFYEKISVPPPTFCPECRFQRRLMFRNERALYKRECGLCGKGIITVFAPDKPYIVYCQSCWWSDKWNPADFGQEYDPSRNFFEQFQELQKKTPYMALINSHSTLINSDYVNHTGNQKNCYLTFNADFNENVAYSTMVNYTKDSLDLQIAGECELCYENVNCGKCYQVSFSEDCTDCTDVYFSKDCIGCQNCFGCVGLRKQRYRIFNQQYSKGEYQEKLKEFALGSYTKVLAHKKKAREFWQAFPRKYMRGLMNQNVSGDYVYECKNAYYMYQARYVEDGKYCQWMTMKSTKDVYDHTEWGNGVQRVYEGITVGEGADSIRFSAFVWDNVREIDYGMFVTSSSNMFGCVNMRKSQFCILNKKYSEEDYRKLRTQIIEDMSRRPYVDTQGREWRYGDFFPYDLSLFDYNESSAVQYYPLEKNEVVARDWRWYEAKPSQHKATLEGSDIPDDIQDVSNSILKEVLGCDECQKAFRLTPLELQLLKRFGFPVPRQCPDCRHMARIKQLNPYKFQNRQCMCTGKTNNSQPTTNKSYTNTAEHFHGDQSCPNEFQTSYAPKRKEIVYCESCYNSEIV